MIPCVSVYMTITKVMKPECISSLTVLKSNFLCIVLGATNSIGET